MKKVQIRISRAHLLASLSSFIAISIVAALVAVILFHIPNSPFAKMNAMMYANHNNPMVLQSGLYQVYRSQATTIDSFISTSIAFLAAGIVYGLVAIKKKLNFPFKKAVFTGIKASILLLCLDGILVLTAELMVGNKDVLSRMNFFTPKNIVMCVVQIILWSACFAAGTVIARVRKSVSPTSIEPQPQRT